MFSTGADKFRLAVEGNPEALAVSSLILQRLDKLISSTEEEAEDEGTVAWQYIVILQRLCNDSSRKYGEDGMRDSVIFFWNKLLDFNGDRDLSDEQLRKLINLGYLFERKRVEGTGPASTDSIIRWIDEANSTYRSPQFRRFTEKWGDYKADVASQFEHQLRQLLGQQHATTSAPLDMMGLLSSSSDGAECVFADLNSTAYAHNGAGAHMCDAVPDFDIAGWTDSVDQYAFLGTADEGAMGCAADSLGQHSEENATAAGGDGTADGTCTAECGSPVADGETETSLFDDTAR
ncbi:hypothetical protein F4775DRAFT_594947 [Biscogniauxia sp. FL1348]|nr:hypothetical protein F4775DRAFT_594947 [Biscogniauxia sp. FL1348]